MWSNMVVHGWLYWPVHVCIWDCMYSCELLDADAESAWKAADKSSLYYRIGGDGLITPAGFVFEDYILANREARALFQGIPREGLYWLHSIPYTVIECLSSCGSSRVFF